jgi:hypothetical protein
MSEHKPQLPFIPNHASVTNGTLTGRVRARRGWFGRMIMQVEFYWVKSFYLYPNAPKMDGELTDEDFEGGNWRDATPDDLTRKQIFTLVQNH